MKTEISNRLPLVQEEDILGNSIFILCTKKKTPSKTLKFIMTQRDLMITINDKHHNNYDIIFIITINDKQFNDNN